MGWNSGWVAAKGISTRKMLDELKLKVVYSTWDFHTRDADVLTTKLESGWLLVDYRENWVGAGDEGPLANLSTHAELVVSCVADEHSMTSEAKAFRAGKKLWEILHAPNDDSEHLEVSGTPPECFEAIRKERLDKLLAYRREGEFHVDTVFDVPVDVCDALVGFRFDRRIELAEPCFILWELG